MVLPYQNDLVGGFGADTWYDQQGNAVYTLRETHDYSGYEIVKVNPKTGETITTSTTWAYPDLSPFLPANSPGYSSWDWGPLSSGWSASHLYNYISEQNDPFSPTDWNSQIVQFSRTTLEPTAHFTAG